MARRQSTDRTDPPPGVADQDTDCIRDRILAAAVELFTEQGYQATSVEQIARRARAAKGSVYWHFKNKESLVTAIVDMELDRVKQRLIEFGLTPDSPPEAIIGAATDLTLWHSEGLDRLRRVMVSAMASSQAHNEDSPLFNHIVQRTATAYDEVLSMLTSAFTSRATPGNLAPDRAAMALLGTVWGLLHILAIMDDPRYDRGSMTDTLRKLFLSAPGGATPTEAGGGS